MRQYLRRICWILGTGLGVGLVPVAPGTFGSLWGPLLVWALTISPFSGWTLVAVVVLIVVAGGPICEQAASYWERKDPGSVVYDEIAAFPVVFLPWLFRGDAISPSLYIVGFVGFRFFDIVKPWPIKRFERLRGGWGIMADDQIAAVYTLLLVYLTTFLR